MRDPCFLDGLGPIVLYQCKLLEVRRNLSACGLILVLLTMGGFLRSLPAMKFYDFPTDYQSPPIPDVQFIESDPNGDFAQASVKISNFNLFSKNVFGVRNRGSLRRSSQISNP